MNDREPDAGTLIVVGKLGNYYGSLQVCRFDGKPHACVENWDGNNWSPCTEKFYEACKQESTNE